MMALELQELRDWSLFTGMGVCVGGGGGGGVEGATKTGGGRQAKSYP